MDTQSDHELGSTDSKRTPSYSHVTNTATERTEANIKLWRDAPLELPKQWWETLEVESTRGPPATALPSPQTSPGVPTALQRDRTSKLVANATGQSRLEVLQRQKLETE